MLQWFLRFLKFAKFTEFPFHLGKTPVISSMSARGGRLLFVLSHLLLHGLRNLSLKRFISEKSKLSLKSSIFCGGGVGGWGWDWYLKSQNVYETEIWPPPPPVKPLFSGKILISGKKFLLPIESFASMNRCMSHGDTEFDNLLPPATVVVERLCFYTCLSVILFTRGVHPS